MLASSLLRHLGVAGAVSLGNLASGWNQSVVEANGLEEAIPAWDIQSSSVAGNNLVVLSSTGINTTSWYHIPTSRCTLMGCLLESGVYNDTTLFFSDNLSRFDVRPFAVPWIYRQEFTLRPAPGRHFILQTHGITSKADVYLNGHQLASKTLQSGAYGGHSYEITSLAATSNALAIQVYPTDYIHDFGQSFVDWNPYPPDNGTGVWRNVTIKQTGAIALGPLRVVTQLGSFSGNVPANLSIKATATNLEDHAVTLVALALVVPESGGPPLSWNKLYTLAANASTDIVLTTTIHNPAIWWHKQSGDQPLYVANLTVSVNGSISDTTARSFGFRTVTSHLTPNNDTLFTVNGHPFQVLGAGYASDMFLRWDSARFAAQAQYMLAMGLNTIRLEGKMEHPELYEMADRLGLMVLPGWECCDKWEAWTYNDNLPSPVPIWSADDYATANASARHEAAMLQTHPSVLGFLVGSDFWPDDRAAAMYVDELRKADWQTPVICSAAMRGHPATLGPSGMKMDGPYDWVPPNYWYDTEPSEDRLGAAFGFGSEQGAGVGTPELSSLKKFLSPSDLDDLWQKPAKNLYHMSTDSSPFHNRTLYNSALWSRYGALTSLEDYVQKAQMADYEATRAEFEAFAALWNAPRRATGVVYWMLNAAWPSLHWALWDWYMQPGGAFFGAKVGCRVEHVAYDYVHKSLYLINRSRDQQGVRGITFDVIDLAGRTLASGFVSTSAVPNTSRRVANLSALLGGIKEVVFLRLVLADAGGAVLSRNVYWLAREVDALDWDGSSWYATPVTRYANYTALNRLAAANVTAALSGTVPRKVGSGEPVFVTLENRSGVPAFFVVLSLVDELGGDVLPVIWSDNYVTLWPGESIEVSAVPGTGSVEPARVLVKGRNVAEVVVSLGGR